MRPYTWDSLTHQRGVLPHVVVPKIRYASFDLWRGRVPAIIFVVFFCANVYLWTLPISQTRLLLIAALLGAAYFSWLLWFVSRDRPKAARPECDPPGKS